VSDARQQDDAVKRFVSFSGGADSTALAIYLADKGEDFTLVFADTGAELPETYWIVPRVARALGKPLVVVSGPTFYQRLVGWGFLLPSAGIRWCTRELKMDPLDTISRTMMVGICADEDHRMPDAHRPLVDAGIGKAEARAMVEERDLLNPCYRWRSNTSCFCCPFQRKSDWRNLQQEHPDLYALAEEWEEQSKLTSPNTKHQWAEGFSLRQLRMANEQQVELFPEPREEACAICQW